MSERPRNFIAELQHSNVLRAAVLYAGAVWASAQGIAQLTPVVGAPEWIARAFLIAAAIGFPFWIAFAWLYEFTPQGLKRESEIARDDSIARSTGRKLDKWIIAVLSIAVVLLLTNTFIWHKGAGLAGHAEANIPDKSIAVLPLDNQSGEKDQQYFSDGLSEDLITALSQFAGLKVISRNSSFQFRDSKQPSATIGQSLGVAHLLEGSVQRLGDQVRITAQLVNAADGSTLWSQHYDRPYKDLFALQDDITEAVVDALKAKLLDGGGAAQSERPPSGNLAAYSAYMQARYHFFLHTGEDTRKAVDFYDHAIHLDPAYARAYAELAIAEVQMVAIFSADKADTDAAVAKARAAAKTALALQPDLGVAHYAQAFILQIVDFDLAGAAREFRRAAELDPQNSATALSLGILDASFGHLDQAVLFGQRAVALDPLNSTNYIYLARTLIAADRYDEAETALRKSIEAHPRAAQAYSELAVLQILRGNPVDARDMATRETDPFWRVYALTLADFANGDRARGDASLKDLIGRYADTGPFQIAQVYALRRQPDQMFEWLDHGLAVRDSGVTTFLYAPFLGAYRNDPRFAAFCRKMGLPTTTDAKAIP